MHDLRAVVDGGGHALARRWEFAQRRVAGLPLTSLIAALHRTFLRCANASPRWRAGGLALPAAASLGLPQNSDKAGTDLKAVDLLEAETILQDAVQRRRRVFGPARPDTLCAVRSLSAVRAKLAQA